MADTRDQTLGTYTTADLLTELVSRKNIECVVAVCFVDGSGNADPDSIYLCGRWNSESAEHFKDALLEYFDECEEEE